MEGKEAIIERIISDANEKAGGILLDAETSVKESIAEANLWVANYKSAQEKIAEKDAAEIISRRKTVAELEKRKLLLKAKQEVLQETFNRALKVISTMPKAKYIKVIDKLLSDFAEKNDKILLAKNSVVKKADILNLAVVSKLKLEVVGEDGEFNGGFKLINDICDKNLSFESILESKKIFLESEIANYLFN